MIPYGGGGASFAGKLPAVVRITIPGRRRSPYGKLDYLLGRVPIQASQGKGKFFGGVLGFDDATLDAALRAHLIAHLGQATRTGNKLAVTGPMSGPVGRTAIVRAVWLVKADGSFDFITAYPS